MLTVIPFSGFYNSIHDSEMDRALEMAMSDDSGYVYDDLYARAFDAVDWGLAHAKYAIEYCRRFAIETGITLQFESMESPREYNFTTDRIYATIEYNELMRIIRATPRETLEEVARQWFTSRSGFMSYYSPNIATWGAVAKYDNNQCGAVIAAYCRHIEFDEDSISEEMSCNGDVDNAIWCGKVLRLNRLDTVARARQERGVTA